jgi:polyphenol oxidase
MMQIVDFDVDLVRIPGWERFGWLRYGFSTRSGGVSSVYKQEGGPDELNLGWTKEDDPGLVAENRRRFAGAVGGEMTGEGGLALVTVAQIHSAIVQAVGKDDGAAEGLLQTAEGKAVLRGDGLMTDVPGVLLGIQTADCVPVMVVDTKKRAVGVFHAGWRGTVAGIVETGVAQMGERYGSRGEDLVAAVGPSIGQCCYSVGQEVREAFEARYGYAGELFSRGLEAERLDLWEANRRQLVEAGVSAEKIAVVGECTACAVVAGGRKRYFSHRGERGFTGRMMSAVGIVED